MYASLCCTLVTNDNMASAYMVQHELNQQPQVSTFQEVILLLTPNHVHSSQALTGLYASPLKDDPKTGLSFYVLGY
jgi:hypothetical protein